MTRVEGEKPKPPVFVAVVAQRSSAPVHCAGAQVFHPCGVAGRQGVGILRKPVFAIGFSN